MLISNMKVTSGISYNQASISRHLAANLHGGGFSRTVINRLHDYAYVCVVPFHSDDLYATIQRIREGWH